MALSIQDCAESITTRLFTFDFNGDLETLGSRLAIKFKKPDGIELELGGYCYNAAKRVIEDELRAWLKSLDD